MIYSQNTRQCFFIWILFCFLFSCKPSDLRFTGIDVSSVRFESVEISGIHEQGHELVVTVPYGTNLKSLKPTFTTVEKAEIIPNLGGLFDFTTPVYFTLVHHSGGKSVYTIRVVYEDQPNPVIEKVEPRSIQAGDKFIISGKSFGDYPGDIAVILSRSNAHLPISLLDSGRIEVHVPDTTTEGSYSFKLQVAGKQTQFSGMEIRYPSPVIDAIELSNYLQGDSLLLKGRFLDNQKYRFSVLYLKGTEPPVAESKLEHRGFSIIPPQIAPGSYRVQVINSTTTNRSPPFLQPIQIYDATKPFVTSLLDKSSEFSVGDTVHVKTKNFANQSFRFYQVLLKGSTHTLVQNAIFRQEDQVLYFELADSPPKGRYHIAVRLASSDLSKLYDFDTNLIISIL